MIVRKAVDGDGGDRVVQRAAQIDRQRLVRLLVEAELADGSGLVPSREIVVARRVVEPELQIVVRPHPLGRVDDAALERREDAGGRDQDRRGARPGDDLVPESCADPEPEALEVGDRVDLLAEPSGHLRRECRALTRDQVERGVGFFPELEPVTLVAPGGHAFRIHAERHRLEPLDRRLFLSPVRRRGHEGVDRALRGGVEALEIRHDLAARERVDTKPPAAQLLDHLSQSLSRALHHVQDRRPRRGHPPLDLRLRDHGGGIEEGDRRGSADASAGPREKGASVSHQATSL